jgi:SpoVK/Ycf46/Vps4 family AAA+-type ATPase
MPQSNGAVPAAAGLTRYEAEGAFALSQAKHAELKPDVIWELKRATLKKSGLLEMHRGTETFSDLGGLDNLKAFCTKAIKSSQSVRARGIMLLGVPGTGKSHFAKALGAEVSRPTLSCDIGSFYGSLVGQTEERIRQALRIADAMAPCVLFIDEIEKALAGVGGQGDSGVATRLFGTLLTWLSDHTSDVFVVATSNDTSKLPPEFCRAERWDGVFFLDLPTRAEKDTIWNLYRKAYELSLNFAPPDDNWTGAEIKACCRLAALLKTDLIDAGKHVVPVAVTAADKVSALRTWASGRCLSASAPGIYQHNQQINGSKRRTISN